MYRCARLCFALIVLLPGISIAAPAESADEVLIDRIAGAVLLDHVYPDISNDIAPTRAYQIQAAVVDGIYGMLLAGYKAGLTSTAAQRSFGFGEPVLGILPQANRLAPGAALAYLPDLKIELQIGFLVGLDGAPGAMLPVVELPRQAYADMQTVALADIVATNVGAYRFITGPTQLADPDARMLTVSLERDGHTLVQGQGADALGDPYRAYYWMVRQIELLGYRLEPGMLLITGALGGVTDAEPGDYVAHYGDPLGDVAFSITKQPQLSQVNR